MNPSYSTGALGGTFDHFHKGHEHFLTFSAQQAQKLLIGVTNQSLVREKELSSIIEPYEVRTEAVRTFCKQAGIDFEIVELTDPYGPTLGQRTVDCLIVTELTQEGGKALNRKREEHQLSALEVFVCPMLKDNVGQVLNSTQIRKGKVNRSGEVYSTAFEKDIILTDDQRNFFKDPLGNIVQEVSTSQTLTAVVGDVSLSTFRQHNWKYDIGVFDHRSQRMDVIREELTDITPEQSVKNPAGTIKPEAAEKIKIILQTLEKVGARQHLFVDGEEDLLSVVLLLLLPLESHLYYGQPGEGMAEVRVTEQLKDRVFQTLL